MTESEELTSPPLEELPDAALYAMLDADGGSDEERRAVANILNARHPIIQKKVPQSVRRIHRTPEDELGRTYRAQTRSALDDLHAETRKRMAARWEGNAYRPMTI